MDLDYIKESINGLLSMKGFKEVDDFPAEFASGHLYEQIVNSLFGTKINLQLIQSKNIQSNSMNWSKINTKICHGYFRKRFYLLEPTMNKLSAGQDDETILKVLKATLETYEERSGQKVIKSSSLQNSNIRKTTTGLRKTEDNRQSLLDTKATRDTDLRKSVQNKKEQSGMIMKQKNVSPLRGSRISAAFENYSPLRKQPSTTPENKFKNLDQPNKTFDQAKDEAEVAPKID